MNRKEILDQANEIIHGSRQEAYGTPEDNFGVISELWTAYLKRRGVLVEGSAVLPADVALLMVLLKAGRAAGCAGIKDNAIDICGYAAIYGEMTAKTV